MDSLQQTAILKAVIDGFATHGVRGLALTKPDLRAMIDTAADAIAGDTLNQDVKFDAAHTRMLACAWRYVSGKEGSSLAADKEPVDVAVELACIVAATRAVIAPEKVDQET